jgi:hypothetical protein
MNNRPAFFRMLFGTLPLFFPFPLFPWHSRTPTRRVRLYSP